MLSLKQQIIKRSFDVSIAFFALIVLLFPLFLLLLVSGLDLGLSGLFTQKRVGREGKLFKMYKIRTLKGNKSHTLEEISTHQTHFGSWLRRTKLDEIPQLFNVLIGDMSLVGPRPDVPGYADKLKGDDRLILKVRPGITGPATLKYKNEDLLLQEKEEAKKFNDEVIWPDKVKINKEYIKNWSFFKDLKYIYKSIIK